eukprot:CAMPEP_0172193780 /NCGR_PEP_ID=MMETSP1050-20130122/25169_1 /TAXON_ID=233186 /ORGANISM="Cryptomonas curvata, Strain CCAP979/52" /LENGTH=174 /DNA_ID=CAMNT_0012869423 /DNA_START=51 /DNA_END=572 /DNA_ORIENTATION=+
MAYYTQNIPAPLSPIPVNPFFHMAPFAQGLPTSPPFPSIPIWPQFSTSPLNSPRDIRQSFMSGATNIKMTDSEGNVSIILSSATASAQPSRTTPLPSPRTAPKLIQPTSPDAKQSNPKERERAPQPRRTVIKTIEVPVEVEVPVRKLPPSNGSDKVIPRPVDKIVERIVYRDVP